MKKITIFAIAAFLALPLGAQKVVSTGTQDIVESAVKPAFVQVKSSYVVRDRENGETYKRDGRDDFNTVTSTGVLVQGGVFVTTSAVRPWEDDAAFREYSSWYDGKTSRVEVALPEGKIFVADSNQRFFACHPDTLIYELEMKDLTSGLKISTATGDVDGWVVLWIKEKDSTITLSSFQRRISFSENTESYEISRPLISSSILGGVFVQPVNTAIGTVEFHLCGLVLDADKKLIVARPTSKQIASKRLTPQTSPKAHEESPKPSTPIHRLININQNKENKGNR